MDFLQSLRNDPGALIVGGVWAVVAIWWNVRQSQKSVVQQDKVANSTNTLVNGLNTLAERLQAQVEAAEARATRLTTESADLYIKLGGKDIELEVLRTALAAAVARAEKAEGAVERLVVDVHNQRRSIESLSVLNRQMLEIIMEREQADGFGEERKRNENILGGALESIPGHRGLDHDPRGPLSICGPCASDE